MLNLSEVEKLARNLFLSGGGSLDLDREVLSVFWDHLTGIQDIEFHPTTSVDDALALVQCVDPKQELTLKVVIRRGQCEVALDGLGATGIASGVEDHRAKAITECALRWWIAHQRRNNDSEDDGA